jgi:predicted nucleotidyltransferase
VVRNVAENVEQELAELARQWASVEVIVLFGSAAKARLTTSSDVDLYVRLAPSSTRDRSAEDAFAAAASRICRREIDLVIESQSTSVILRREVARTGRLLFERRAGAFRAFVVDAIRAYVDLEPQLRLIGEAIRARAALDGARARERLIAAEAARGR